MADDDSSKPAVVLLAKDDPPMEQQQQQQQQRRTMNAGYKTFLLSCLYENHNVYTLKQLVERENGPKLQELPPNLQSPMVLEAPLHQMLSKREDVKEVVDTYIFDHISSKIMAWRKREEEQFESLFADSDEKEADEEEQQKPLSKDGNMPPNWNHFSTTTMSPPPTL